MNFIKKKIKGSKKAITSDDDDLDPNLFHVPHSAEGGSKGFVPYDERIDQESEEWLAFKQLTQRVTDTLQQTQLNLSKIVATSALDEKSKDIKTVTHPEDEAPINGFNVPAASTKPGRPPPPRPAPPRPDPPQSAPGKDPFDPAGARQTEATGTHLELEFDLHAEFGFRASPVTPLATAGSLFLDDDSHIAEDTGDDPFDTSFVATSTESGIIPGLVPIEELEGFQDDEEDDPFIVKEIVLATAMDPFDSFLGSSATQPAARSKSPNPFLTDAQPQELASSNPFASSASNDVDFFAGSAPNPFAAVQEPEQQNKDVLDLFGSATDLAATNSAAAVNPFASFTQSNTATADLFDLDFDSPATNAIPPPIIPKVSDHSALKFQSSQQADPFASLMDNDTTTSGAPQPDLFGFGSEESHEDPFGGSTNVACPPKDFATGQSELASARRVSFDMAPTVVNDLELTFGGTNSTPKKSGPPIPPKSANFPEPFVAKEVAHPPARPPPPSRPARPPPPSITVKMDQPGQAWDEPIHTEKKDIFDAFSAPLQETKPAAFDAFGSTQEEAAPAFDTFSSQCEGGDSKFDAFDIPTPMYAGDPFGAALTEEEKIEFEPIPCTVAKVEAEQHSGRQDFDAFGQRQDEVTSERKQSLDFAMPERKQSLDHVTPERKQSLDHVTPERKQSLDYATPERKRSMDFVATERKMSTDFVTPERKQSLDYAAPERKKSIDFVAPTQATQPMSAVDFFSGFDMPETKGTTVVAASIPRPPSVEMLDSFGTPNEAELSLAEVPVQEPAPSAIDLIGENGGFFEGPETMSGILEATVVPVPATATYSGGPLGEEAAFDAFDAKFQSMSGQSTGAFDAFADVSVGASMLGSDSAAVGFGAADEFDPFFAIKESPAAPKPSPARFSKKKAGEDSDSDFDDDDTGPDFSVFIRPKIRDKDDVNPNLHLGPIPVLAPPPKSPIRSPTRTSPTPRFNPFDKEPGAPEQARESEHADITLVPDVAKEVPHDLPGVMTTDKSLEKTESQESPGSPLFDLDDSEPLEDFYPKFMDEGWELLLRQPSKKKLTGQRFWKKVWVTLSDNGVIHLYNKREDKDAFQELPLQACYSLSEIGAQQYDAYGKIFTFKLQYVFYRERVGVRPGQISKVAHGQITSLGQLAKLGLPLEHAPQVSQLLKIGSPTYTDLKVFVRLLEDTLFHLTVHRDRALTYKTEEVQVTVIDELRAEVACSGIVLQQLARVRVFFLAFITSMPDVEIGLNDITKQGKEVVGRHDIIPVITEEWIRLEKVEFHSCVLVEEFEKSRNIRLHPPDACFFELLRFRIRPPRNRELPLQVKTTMSVIGNRVEIRADVLVPGCISRKHGQIPCEDVSIRFPLPECWIYLFRVEKHFRYGSVKSASRKPGKIKGLERFMGAGLTLEPSLIEVSTGQAKYEHQHRAIVWRIPRLPKDGQGAYTTQLFVCRMELTSYDQIPEEFDRYIYVEFNMPATTVSHTTVRSVSVTNPNPPEKYVKYLARHEYRIEMEHVTVASECEYMAATAVNASTAASSAGGSGSPVPSQ